MQTTDFFRRHIDVVVNLKSPLAALAIGLPLNKIEAAKAVMVKFARPFRGRPNLQRSGPVDHLCSPGGRGLQQRQTFQATDSPDGQPAADTAQFQPHRRKLALRWSETTFLQFFTGTACAKHRLPGDATQIGRFRRDPGEEGRALPLKATIDKAVATRAVSTAKRAGICLKQPLVKAVKAVRWRAGGQARAKQFRRIRKVVKRQRTVLGFAMREVQYTFQTPDCVPAQP